MFNFANDKKLTEKWKKSTVALEMPSAPLCRDVHPTDTVHLVLGHAKAMSQEKILRSIKHLSVHINLIA